MLECEPRHYLIKNKPVLGNNYPANCLVQYSSEDWVVRNNGEKQCLSKSGSFKERAQSVRTGIDLRYHLGLGLILQIRPMLTEGYW